MAFRDVIRAGADTVKGVLESRRRYGTDSDIVTMPARLIVPKAYGDDSGFDPESITGLELWLDASSGLYTTEDATTAAVADGTAVGAWRDRSSNENLFVQSVAGSRPTLKLGVINGHPVVRGDGSADHLKIASAVLTGASGSVFAVYSVTDETPAVSLLLLTSSDEATGTRFWRIIACSTTSVLGIQQRNNDTQDFVVGDSALSPNVVMLNRWESTGAAYGMRNDGAAETITVSTGADNGDWLGDTTGLDNVVLFAQQNSGGVTNHFAGDLAELLVYTPQVSAAEATRIERYLANKYGIGIG